MGDTLKPCPFCGGDAELERAGNTRISTIVRCLECGCYLENGATFNHGSAWNTRAAPTVKPLVWENFDAWTWWCHTEVGTYRVNERSGHWTASKTPRANGEANFLYQYKNSEISAKDAAQNDYKARILSALEDAA